MDNIIFKVYSLLFELSKRADSSFSGIGIIVYDSKKFLKDYYCSLRPNFYCEDGLFLGDQKLADYLYTIGNNNHPFHDGFQMINKDGRLTHVSQYFAPPIVHNISPNPKHGARVHSSICGSLLEGVIVIGVLSSKGNIYLYENGKEHDISNVSIS